MRKLALCAVTFHAAASIAWGQPTRLNILGRWDRPIPGGSERFCTIWQNDAPGGLFEGQVAYLAANPNADRTELRRYYNASNGDHMESVVPVDPVYGYTYEGPHGYVWTSQITGTVPINRWLRSAPFDHASAHFGDQLPGGYATNEGQMGYVFPRYLNQAEQLLSLTNGHVTIKSNLVAGGAIWEWNQGGFQYVNDWDYGRQIQSALYFQVEAINPTEAGDKFTTPADAWKHGSPLIGAANNGFRQVTASVPLQWVPELYGGDAHHPVIWLGYQIGKEITLNVDGMPRVARYVTHITSGAAHSNAFVAVPAVFTVAELDHYYIFNVAADILTPVSVAQQCIDPGYQYVFEDLLWPVAGAGIVTNELEDRAIGIYARNDTAYPQRFYLADVSGPPEICGPGTGQFGQQFSAVHAQIGPINLPPGPSSYTTYIASGTLEQVRSDFRTLYLAGR